MNYIRELLYRPRKSDRSNMARFFFADENLTQVSTVIDCIVLEFVGYLSVLKDIVQSNFSYF